MLQVVGRVIARKRSPRRAAMQYTFANDLLYAHYYSQLMRIDLPYYIVFTTYNKRMYVKKLSFLYVAL